MTYLTNAPSFTLKSRVKSTTVIPTRPTFALPDTVLARHAMWLCRVRWFAVGILVIFGAVGFVTDHIAHVDLVISWDWPLPVAVILGILNIGFYYHARIAAERNRGSGADSNILAQIASDLIAHTIVLHFLGTVETYGAFVYLFHIVLSCMFLGRGQSLFVALSACVLYALCFGLEAAGVLDHVSVYGEAGHWTHIERVAWPTVFNIGSAMGILLVAWYVASHMTTLLRERDAALTEANRLLSKTQEAKTKHLLRTTHELKAPFAAIHANTQLLLKGYCGTFSDEATKVLHKIAARCRRLAREIQSMLQLANLRAADIGDLSPVQLQLTEVAEASLSHVKPIADERHVAVEVDIEPATVRMEQEHLRMVLDNLLTNAILYSHENGTVNLACHTAPDGDVVCAIEDHGIGIKEEKLSRIFEEYYRTDEAGRHNKQASGLGLTIVEDISHKYGIAIRVESRIGEGTRVTVRLPHSS
jgi:signal transduction histidine kinase